MFWYIRRYLKAYMAWMHILRRKRKGYADPMPVEVIPVFLANALGPQAAAFGQHLVRCVTGPPCMWLYLCLCPSLRL